VEAAEAAATRGKTVMKVIISTLLSLFLLTACGSGADTAADGAYTEAPAEAVIEIPTDIGIIDTYVEDRGVLRIATMYYQPDEDNWSYRMLDEAVRIFEEKYIGWRVQIEPEGQIEYTETINPDGTTSYISRGDGRARDAFFQTLPNRLMQDDGPDIIIMDGADTQRLLERNLLMDMMGLFEADDELSLSRLLPGVVNAMTIDKGLYMIPVSFTVSAIFIISDEIVMADFFETKPDNWEWMDLHGHFKETMANNEKEYLFQFTVEHKINRLMQEYLECLYDHGNDRYDYDTQAFREIIRTVKFLYDRKLILDDNEPFPGFDSILFSTLFLPGDITDFTEFELTSRLYDEYNIRMYPNPTLRGGEGMAVIPMDTFAISVNAPQKTAAWEFMKILLSDEIQCGPEMLYQPVIADLNEEAVKRITRQYEVTPEDTARYNMERNLFFSGINREWGYGSRGQSNPILPLSEILRYTLRYCNDEIDLDTVVENVQKAADRLNNPRTLEVPALPGRRPG
jgi:ABC-type glycerol-3-phosphate transport system substrate-binding protein